MLITRYPVAVAVAAAAVVVVVVVVVACACKFVKVSIKGGAYITAGVFVPSLPSIIVIIGGGVPFSGKVVHNRWVRWGLWSLAAVLLPLR